MMPKLARDPPMPKREITKPQSTEHLFRGRRVLGDRLGALRHGVLSKLTGQDQADRGLDLSGRDGGLLVVGSKLGSLSGNALKDVWDLESAYPFKTVSDNGLYNAYR